MGRFFGLLVIAAVIFSLVTYLLFRMFLRWRWVVLMPSVAALAMAFYYFFRSLRPSEGLSDIAYRLMAMLFLIGGLAGLMTGLWLKVRIRTRSKE